MSQIAKLKEKLKSIYCLREVSELLSWDQETYMPEGAAEARADQMAVVSELAHQQFISPEMGRLIEEAQQEVEDPQSEEGHLVRKVAREYKREHQVPQSLVAKLASAVSRAQTAWVKARAEGKFSLMQDEIEQVLDYVRQTADYYGYQEHIYDALLEGYEPGCTTSQITQIFSALRPHLVDLVSRIKAKGPNDHSLLTQTFPIATQRLFTRQISTDMGYDWSRGRTDDVIHPFCASFSTRDVRITNIFIEDELSRGIFGAMHETGHALYEQGSPARWIHSPLEGGASMGWHESQSRLWENIIGRSLPLWEHYYPQLQKLFPEQLKADGLQEFYKAINLVEPSFIRTEADEVTYNLHIMLRFEMEKALIEGSIAVKDVPEIWNEAMHSYLGIVPHNDREGCAQDVHWPLGLFGYFPSYALGNLRSAQVWETMCAAMPGIKEELRQGHLTVLRDWLQEHVYCWGARLLPNELMLKVTGEELRPEPFVRYLENKYSAIYNL